MKKNNKSRETSYMIKPNNVLGETLRKGSLFYNVLYCFQLL